MNCRFSSSEKRVNAMFGHNRFRLDDIMNIRDRFRIIRHVKYIASRNQRRARERCQSSRHGRQTHSSYAFFPTVPPPSSAAVSIGANLSTYAHTDVMQLAAHCDSWCNRVPRASRSFDILFAPRYAQSAAMNSAIGRDWSILSMCTPEILTTSGQTQGSTSASGSRGLGESREHRVTMIARGTIDSNTNRIYHSRYFSETLYKPRTR